MNMLSVLLHEYGHALGLEDSGDARDAMAATLQPGVRRLPSAEELALMSRLVAQLRTDESGDDQPGQDFGIARKEINMLSIDMAFVDADRKEIVAIANKKQDVALPSFYGAVGGCMAVFKKMISETRVEGLPKNGSNVLLPGHSASRIFLLENKKEINELDELIDQANSASAVVISGPRHGKIALIDDKTRLDLHMGFGVAYLYKPNIGYIGRDEVTFMVEFGDYRIKVKYYINVNGEVINLKDLSKIQTRNCPRIYWKISTQSRVNGSSTAGSTADYQAWRRSAELSALLANAGEAFQGFANLSGLATGQTTGTQITLDTNAAGHGWYIDAAPLDNSDDYLPTVDPTIWKAKQGTTAGKMDLLSELLHEYGHVLGLEHSADVRGFMAPSLRPGERRLPTAEELRLMGRLIAEIKVAESEQSPGNPDRPWDQPISPVPGQSSSTGRRLARRSPAGSREGDDAAADNLGAVSSSLANGDFGADATSGWVSEGVVNVTGDSVTLSESGTHQTHLARSLVINQGDRALRPIASVRAMSSRVTSQTPPVADAGAQATIQALMQELIAGLLIA